MYSEECLNPFSVWTHTKSGGTYIVLGVSTCSTNGPCEGVERVVVYMSTTYQQLRHRDVKQFLDGRFVPMPKR